MNNAIAATHILQQFNPSTQPYHVLNHLIMKGSISPLEASKGYGVERLTSRIFDIKRRGDLLSTPVQITKEMRSDLPGKRYVRYFLQNN